MSGWCSSIAPHDFQGLRDFEAVPAGHEFFFVFFSIKPRWPGEPLVLLTKHYISSTILQNIDLVVCITGLCSATLEEPKY